VQRRHDDFERRLLRKFRVRVDRDAAAVIRDGEEATGFELDLDEGGVAGHRLVHGVVDHLGEEVVQGLFVGPPDIHAGPAPHRLQSLEDLDGGGVIGRLGPLRLSRDKLRPRRRTGGCGGRFGSGLAERRSAEEIAFVGHWS
jgi:hypothetical protein